jgi:hypothetical protein
LRRVRAAVSPSGIRGTRVPKRNSIRYLGTGPPEVWFGIVHVAEGVHNGVPVAELRDQTVEVALGPNGVFDNGNVGTVTRRVAADRGVTAVTRARGDSKQV